MPLYLIFHLCLFSENAGVNCSVYVVSLSLHPGQPSHYPVFDVCAGMQLIVALYVNLDAASLMSLVIVLKYMFLLLSVITAVKEAVCIVIFSLVSLAFSSANLMAVISASSTDAESLSLMIIPSFLCTTAAATRVPSLEPSVYYYNIFIHAYKYIACKMCTVLNMVHI